MTKMILAVGLSALALVGCTESKRARNAATFGDKPADITCWTYGTETYSGRSTGKVEYNDGGRIAFVDAANDRYTTIDGECRVVYLMEGEATEPVTDVTEAPTAAAVPKQPTTPDQ